MAVRITKTAAITVPDNRIRRKFDEKKIEELAEDIHVNGLLHPPTLREKLREDGNTEKQEGQDAFILVAGERRLRAIQYLQSRNLSFRCDSKIFDAEYGLCPFMLMKDLTPSSALEMELHENLIRVDLDWQDVVSARAQLHELRQEEANSAGLAWTVKQTAEELASKTDINQKSAENAIAQATRLADYLDDPDIGKARNAKEAERMLLKKIEGEMYKAFMEAEDREHKKHREHEKEGREGRKEREGTNAPSLPQRQHTLICADFRKLASRIPQNHFDCIIADPPYGVNAESFGDAAIASHNYTDDKASALSVAESIFNLGNSWAKEQAHLFMFCDIDLFPALKELAIKYNWRPFRTPIVWHKPTQGHMPWGMIGLRRETEYILFASKNNRPLLKLQEDIITMQRAREDSATFAPRKPIALYELLISLSCLPHSHVIDPTCGSGVIFPAAENCKVTAWGIEQNVETHKLAALELGRVQV